MLWDYHRQPEHPVIELQSHGKHLTRLYIRIMRSRVGTDIFDVTHVNPFAPYHRRGSCFNQLASLSAIVPEISKVHRDFCNIKPCPTSYFHIHRTELLGYDEDVVQLALTM